MSQADAIAPAAATRRTGAARPLALLGSEFATLFRRRRTIAMLAGLMILWFVATDEIPEELVFITAPVLTLVVLVVAGRSLRPPRYDGYVWRRGEGG